MIKKACDDSIIE